MVNGQCRNRETTAKWRPYAGRECNRPTKAIYAKTCRRHKADHDRCLFDGADFASGFDVFVDWCSVGFDAWRCHRDRIRLAAMLARQSARVISCLLWCH